jgi:hypothetical protein
MNAEVCMYELFLLSGFIPHGRNCMLYSSTGVSGAIYFLVDIQDPKQAKFPAFEL